MAAQGSRAECEGWPALLAVRWASPQRPLSGLVASQCSAHLHGGCYLRLRNCLFSAPFPAGVTASVYHCSIPESLLVLARLASLGLGVHMGQTPMWGHVCLAVSSAGGAALRRPERGRPRGALGKQAGEGGLHGAPGKQAGGGLDGAPGK